MKTKHPTERRSALRQNVMQTFHMDRVCLVDSCNGLTNDREMRKSLESLLNRISGFPVEVEGS